MVADIWEVITAGVTQFIACLTSGVTSIVSLVYDATAGEMTFLGTLLLLSVAFGIVYWIFRLIRGVVAGVAR